MKFNKENIMRNVGMGIYLIGFVALFITSFNLKYMTSPPYFSWDKNKFLGRIIIYEKKII